MQNKVQIFEKQPAALVIIGLGLAGLGLARRKRKVA
jgi:hypothetical protein